jgi:hypothetical protein
MPRPCFPASSASWDRSTSVADPPEGRSRITVCLPAAAGHAAAARFPAPSAPLARNAQRIPRRKHALGSQCIPRPLPAMPSPRPPRAGCLRRSPHHPCSARIAPGPPLRRSRAEVGLTGAGAATSLLEARSSKLEARSSKLEARSSKLEARSSKLEARSSKLEARSRKQEAGSREQGAGGVTPSRLGPAPSQVTAWPMPPTPACGWTGAVIDRRACRVGGAAR